MRKLLELAGVLGFFFLFAVGGSAVLFVLAVLVQPDRLPPEFVGLAWLALTVAAVAVPLVIGRAALAHLGRRQSRSSSSAPK